MARDRRGASNGPTPGTATSAQHNSDDAEHEVNLAARHSVWFAAGIAMSSALQFGFILLVTHTASQRVAGAFFESVAVFTIFSNVAELGADSGLLRFMPIARARRPEQVRALVLVGVLPAVAFSIVGGLCGALAAAPIARFLAPDGGAHALASVRLLLVFLPAATCFSVLIAALRAWGPRLPVLLNYVVAPVGRVVIYLALFALGVQAAAAWAWAVPLAVGTVLAALGLMHLLRTLPEVANQPAVSVAKEFWRYSAPRSLAASFQVLVTWLDVVLVGHYSSPADAAAYAAASRYLLVVTTLGQGSVAAAITPQFSRLMDGDRLAEAKAVYQAATSWIVMLTWPVFVALATGAAMFSRALGEGYESAATALTILSLAMLVNMATGPNDVLLLMAGRSGLSLLIQAVGLTLNVSMNIVLIPRLGIAGAAWSWAVSILTVSIAASLVLWRQTKIQPVHRGLVGVAGAALVSVGAPGVLARQVLPGSTLATAGLLAFGAAAFVAVVAMRRDRLGLHGINPLPRLSRITRPGAA